MQLFDIRISLSSLYSSINFFGIILTLQHFLKNNYNFKVFHFLNNSIHFSFNLLNQNIFLRIPEYKSNVEGVVN